MARQRKMQKAIRMALQFSAESSHSYVKEIFRKWGRYARGEARKRRELEKVTRDKKNELARTAKLRDMFRKKNDDLHLKALTVKFN